MNKTNLLSFLIAVSFVISGVLATWTYKQSYVDYQEHRIKIESVREIRILVSDLIRELVFIKEGQVAHYDRTVKIQRQLNQWVENLAVDQASYDLKRSWNMFKQKVERIKSDSAVYRNSLFYFPQGIDDFSSRLTDKSEHRVFMKYLFALERQVFLLGTGGLQVQSVPVYKTIETLNNLIKTLSKKEGLAATMLIKHAEVLVNHATFYHQGFYRLLLTTDVLYYSKQLMDQYNNDFQQQVDQAGDIRKLFYIVSLLMMLIILYAFLKLRTVIVALNNRAQMLRQVSDNAPVMLWMSDKKGNLVFSNNRWDQVAGTECDKNIFTSSCLEFVHPNDRDQLIRAYKEQVDKTEVSTVLYRIKSHHAETYQYLSTNIVARVSDSAEYQGLICSTVDLTQQIKMEEETHLAAQVFEHSLEGILISNEDNKIIKVNQAFTKMTGYTAEDVLGQSPSLLTSGMQDRSFYRSMWKSINNEGYWCGEVFNRRKNGEVFPEWLTITVLKDSHNKVTHHLAIFSDITEQKRAEQDIHFLAHYDALTRLPNRILFYERAEHVMVQAARNKESIAILFLDLDRFKAVNDSLGHDAGDELLIQVAEDLSLSIRDVDLVARIGGDEFVIVLEGLNQQTAAIESLAITEAIIQRLSREYHIKETQVFIGVSIGVALFPEDGRSIEDLVRHADMAMYHAKDQGRNNVQFYSEQLNEMVQKRLRLEADLRVAIEQNQLYLDYQPQYNLQTLKVEGVEALIRWSHPEKGLVSPEEFIDIAEECGLIVELGQWVLETACRQLSIWQQKNIFIRMAINVSVKQLEREDFIRCVIETLEKTKIAPEFLEIEVTESIFLEEDSMTKQLLGQLAQLGVQISMDDFGTGYSNMSYLKKLPIDRIKIDRCFIIDLPNDESNVAITCAIIDIARHFGIKVIAEGIENQQQLDFLLSKGCDEGQGYFLGKPLSEQEILDHVLQAVTGVELITN